MKLPACLRQWAGVGIAALFLTALPAPARADGDNGEKGSVALGPTIGFDTGNSITQLRVTGEGQFTITDIAPKLYVELAGHIGFSIGSQSLQGGYGNPTATSFEIVPAVRLRYAVDEKLSFYGDVDVGIAYFAFGTINVATPLGTFSYGGGSQTWGLFRIGFGVQYKVTPQVILFGEPVGLNVYVGNGAGFMYSLAVGVLFKV